MTGHVALVRERGLRFAVVVVRPSLMSGVRRERDEAVRALSEELGVPAVLMIRGSRGTPTFHGRDDLVGALESLCVEQLAWRELSVEAA